MKSFMKLTLIWIKGRSFQEIIATASHYQEKTNAVEVQTTLILNQATISMIMTSRNQSLYPRLLSQFNQVV